MYGYGYRYPRVPRKIEALYDDPRYRFKWVRAAIGNRAVASKSPWIAHLQKAGVFKTISEILRKEALEYRKIKVVLKKVLRKVLNEEL
jgi:hypothetical protein